MLSERVAEYRWKMLGHVLRSDLKSLMSLEILPGAVPVGATIFKIQVAFLRSCFFKKLF